MNLKDAEIKLDVTSPPLTAELAVRAFEALSKTRNNRPQTFSAEDTNLMHESEDLLYRMLLERLKYEAVIVKIEEHHGTP